MRPRTNSRGGHPRRYQESHPNRVGENTRYPYSPWAWQGGIEAWAENHQTPSSINSATEQSIREFQELSELKLSQIPQHPDNLQEYFHLLATARCLEPRIYGPIMFGDTDRTHEDRQVIKDSLSAGYAGILGELVDGLVSTQRDLRMSQPNSHKANLLTEARQNYTGLISELTFLVAVNSLNSPNIMAVQSMAREDLRQGIDAWVYTISGPDEDRRKTPIQIKTSTYYMNKSRKTHQIPMEFYNKKMRLTYELINKVNYGREMNETATADLDNLAARLRDVTRN